MIKYDVIEKYSGIHPDKKALKDDRWEVTWSDFKLYTRRLIGVISKMDRLEVFYPSLFISNNSIDVVLLGAAFSSLGIPFQGLDYHLDILVIKKIIKDLNVKHVFISRELEVKFSDLSLICNLHFLNDIIEKAKKSTINEIEPIKTLSMPFKSFAFTSGTTGNPKIAYRLFSFDKRRFEYLQDKYLFTFSDIHLACLPMYHVSTTGWLRLFLGLGCTVVIHNFKNGYQLCETIHANHISTTILSPIILKHILSELGEDDKSTYFPSLRFVVTGGKNCSIKIKQEAIRKLGKIIYEYYGTTETGINTLLSTEEAIELPGSVGREFEGNKIAILSDQNTEVPAGEVGRIAIYSYMNFDGYLNHSADFVTLDRLKYVLTYDYGYKNVNGYLFIVQRASYIPKKVYNFYGLENDVLDLGYLADVCISESKENDAVNIFVVPKRYYPYLKVQSDIKKISEKYGVKNSVVNVASELSYTLTGKIKSSLPISIKCEKHYVAK